MTNEHEFAQYVRILGKGRKGTRSLDYQEALDAMGMVLNGQCEDVQLGAFMMLLRVKEESGAELAGFTQAAKNYIQHNHPHSVQADLDWSSYAGKRRHLPWYILASLALADNGYRVFMHGADGHTQGRVYTRQALAELGIQPARDWQAVEQQLDDSNFSFMGMESLCPPLQDIIDLRSTFGLRSPVHSFARLLNPLDCQYVTQGVFHPGYGPSHQQSAKLLNYSRLSILKGEGGECECNPDSVFKMHHCFDGQLIEEEWPAIFARRHVKPKTLDLSQLKSVWKNEIQDEYGEGAIIGTLAYTARLMGVQTDYQACLTQAKSWWQNRNHARFD